ncbi:ribosomal protein S17 [Hamiltosporidium tvaerminnensis]|uniref:Small ribosomal subunit protein uS17 n=2 Tax=Hamiltosporidium TaxID=1176354 RepID=A0A4Q9LNL4_9MICR|nr:40S ribosomal protein S11-B [Hamiltosporidium tvaerminnensis]TBT99449.1 ribosomal protein S17 [Hamiltosporidium tvaerminnensis]TBU07573.1 ribosomal protein S17 [Hamiltosporidium magnivora]TBU09546.1 ribosomal protein S17 [Hamiltosporidium magnivora]TBU20459.1 ribosomal protein S17 [Hamiltosporidium tvaerminnensis]
MSKPTFAKEKLFPQQIGVYINPLKKADDPSQPKRFYKEIRGFKTPETAINGTYFDKKCPFTGNVTVRGRIFKGEVIRMKMDKTITVVKKYLHYVPKYKRYERRNTKFSVHMSPCFHGLINIGDSVTCAEVRPLSRTKKFVIVDFEKKKVKTDKFKILSH